VFTKSYTIEQDQDERGGAPWKRSCQRMVLCAAESNTQLEVMPLHSNTQLEVLNRTLSLR